MNLSGGGDGDLAYTVDVNNPFIVDQVPFVKPRPRKILSMHGQHLLKSLTLTIKAYAYNLQEGAFEILDLF